MSFLEIDDSLFQCVAAGIGKVTVPEELSIIDCCQDADNFGVIYINCSLRGIYEYTPKCVISWEGGSVDVSNLIIYGYKASGIQPGLLSVGCGTGSFLLAYNVSSVIPSFDTLKSINVTLQFIGTVTNTNLSQYIQSLGLFSSSNPSSTVTLNKGLNPKPYKIYFDAVTNKLKVQYSNLGNNACLCAIDCVSPTVDDFQLTICEDEIQEISINSNSIFGDPTDALVTLADAKGNKTKLTVHSMMNVNPVKPNVFLYTTPIYNNISILFASANGTPIDYKKVKVQVLKYENNPDNVYVWKDWTSKSWTSLYDKNVIPGRRYGYAVRFKGEFGEISNISDWTVVEVI